MHYILYMMSIMWVYALCVHISVQGTVLSTLDDLGIQVQQTQRSPYAVYQVQPFTGLQRWRNHYNKRPDGARVQYIILHYTATDFAGTMRAFTQNTKRSRVSAHYVITQDGTIVHVVPEHKRAWHAGRSYWNGLQDLNDISIGVEIVNNGYTRTEDGKRWHPFAAEQIHAVGQVCADIVERYGIPRAHVLGHADIAPHRKVDPGPLFPWNMLYDKHGLGPWLTSSERTDNAVLQRLPKQTDVTFVLRNLSIFGYHVEDFNTVTSRNQSVIQAFKAHFTAHDNLDQYDTTIRWEDMIWSCGLVHKYKPAYV